MASIFTQIMNKSLSGHFVYEDSLCVAIMTIQPVKPGHVLVIPREEVDCWDDLPDDTTAHLMGISKKVTKAIKLSFKTSRVGFMIAGFEIPHTHIHLIPANSMADFSLSGLSIVDDDILERQCQLIKSAL